MYLGVNIEDNQNEIDIIINAGERLVFVECKTRIFAITDLDKFNEVARKYSGTATVKLFVQNERLEDDVKEKCKRGISAFSFEENGGMFNERAKDNLFELLDVAMLETQTK